MYYDSPFGGEKAIVFEDQALAKGQIGEDND
jgi:hypothetical protein